MKKLTMLMLIFFVMPSPTVARNVIFSSYYGTDGIKYEYTILNSKKWKNGKSWGFEVTIRVSAQQQNQRAKVGRPVALIVDCTIPEVGRSSGNGVETMMTGDDR